MPNLRLLVLHLASSLAYDVPAQPIPDPDVAPDSDHLFAYREDSLPRGVPKQTEAGLEQPPLPHFSGTARRAVSHEGPDFAIAAGDYFFCQWKAGDFPKALEGLDAFAAAVKLEAAAGGRRTVGPWMLRILAEDGGTVFQGLRRIDD